MTNRILRFIFTLAGVLTLGAATAQEAPVRHLAEHAELRDLELTLGKNDSVTLSFLLRTSARKLPANTALMLRPAVRNDGRMLPLRPVRIAVPYMQRKDRRERILAGNRSEPIELLVTAGEEVRYELGWPYEEWMEHLSLDMEAYYEGCRHRIFGRRTFSLADDEQIYFPPVYVAPRITEVPVPKHLIERMAAQNAFISASKESEARESDALAFAFRQGSAYLDLKADQNGTQMKTTEEALLAIQSNSDVTLRKVRLVGYASVEGSKATNDRLATARAEAVYNAIGAAVRPTREKVEIVCGGENWNDLLQQVEADTSVPRRDEVLKILREEPDTELRKKQLRALPDAYAYLMKNIFPRQRSAGYLQVFFDVVRRSDRNQQIAIRYNDAATAVAAGRYDEAVQLLDQSTLPLPEAHTANIRGVCLWMQGDLEGAARYFRTALDIDPSLEAARQNLTAVEGWDEHHILQPVVVSTPAEEE